MSRLVRVLLSPSIQGSVIWGGVVLSVGLILLACGVHQGVILLAVALASLVNAVRLWRRGRAGSAPET